MKKEITKDNVNYLSIFTRFLKEYGLYYRYFKNIDDNGRIHLNEIINKKPIAHFDLLYLVDYAFQWSTTSEGHSFWSDVDNVWGSIYHYISKRINDRTHTALFYTDLTKIFKKFYDECPFN